MLAEIEKTTLKARAELDALSQGFLPNPPRERPLPIPITATEAIERGIMVEERTDAVTMRSKAVAEAIERGKTDVRAYMEEPERIVSE
jgi:hypothetical protein